MKWMVTVVESDSSVEQTTYNNKSEAVDYYNHVVTTSREKHVAIKVHLATVGQVLEFKKKKEIVNGF